MITESQDVSIFYFLSYFLNFCGLDFSVSSVVVLSFFALIAATTSCLIFLNPFGLLIQVIVYIANLSSLILFHNHFHIFSKPCWPFSSSQRLSILSLFKGFVHVTPSYWNALFPLPWQTLLCLLVLAQSSFI